MLKNLTRLLVGLLVAVSFTAPSFAANSWYDFVVSEPSTSVSGGVNGSETVLPSQVNDAMRAWKQLEAAWLDDLGGIATVGGTSTAITVTLSQGFTAYGTGAGQIPNGAVIAIKTGSAASGATTLNINGIGAKAIRRQGDSAIQANDWLSGAVVLLRYDTAYNAAAGAWVLLNPQDVVTALQGLGSGVATWLATPSSANLRGALTDETGTGAAVFAGGSIGNASASSLAITANNVPTEGLYLPSAGTLGIAASSTGQVFITSGAMTPRVNSGTDLGSASLAWNDVNLQGNLKWQNNNVTLSTTANTSLNLSGGTAAILDLSSATAGRIKFPASQTASADANTLDDYEEGAWTPSLGGNTTYTVQGGRYIKTGKMVWVQFRILPSAIGTGSTTVISGLPFTSGSNIDLTPCYTGKLTGSATAVVSVTGTIAASGTSITLSSRTGAAVSDGSSAIFATGTDMTMSCTYEAAA